MIDYMEMANLCDVRYDDIWRMLSDLGTNSDNPLILQGTFFFWSHPKKARTNQCCARVWYTKATLFNRILHTEITFKETFYCTLNERVTYQYNMCVFVMHGIHIVLDVIQIRHKA